MLLIPNANQYLSGPYMLVLIFHWAKCVDSFVEKIYTCANAIGCSGVIVDKARGSG